MRTGSNVSAQKRLTLATKATLYFTLHPKIYRVKGCARGTDDP
nr:MAG TPA: hypothetical protein [Caudoviricetes sp.]